MNSNLNMKLQNYEIIKTNTTWNITHKFNVVIIIFLTYSATYEAAMKSLLLNALNMTEQIIVMLPRGTDYEKVVQIASLSLDQKKDVQIVVNFEALNYRGRKGCLVLYIGDRFQVRSTKELLINE